MIRHADQLGDGPMLGWRDHTFVDDIVIRVERRLFPILGREFLPEGCGTLTTTVTHVESDDLARRRIHRNPDPLPVCLLAYEAPELIQLGLQPLQDHLPGAIYWLGIEIFGGGSNGSRCRLWKVTLQRLADELGLRITVCHFPPGTSKWNKIEHRLFSHIDLNRRGHPLSSLTIIVNM